MTFSFYALLNCYWSLSGMEHPMSSSPVYNWMTMDSVLYRLYVHKWIYNGFYGYIMPVRLPVIALLFSSFYIISVFYSLLFLEPLRKVDDKDAPFKVLILSILTSKWSIEEKLLGQDWGQHYSIELILLLLEKGLLNSEGWISEHGAALTVVLKYK